MGLFSLNNIRNKYLIVLLLLCLFPLSIITHFSNITYKKYLVKSVGEHTQSIALETISRIDGLLFEEFVLLQEIGINPIFKGSRPSTDDINRIFFEMKGSIEKDHVLIYLDDKGKIIASSDTRLIGDEKSEQRYFKVPFVKKGDFISQVYNDHAIGKHFFISTKVLDGNGRTIGLLALRSSLTPIEEILHNIGKDISFEVIDSEGNIVVDSHNGLSVRIAPTMLHSVKEVLTGNSGYAIERNVHNIDSIIGYANTKLGIEGGWSVLIHQQEKEALASLYALWGYTWMAFFIIASLTMGATVYLSRRLSAPIVKLSEAAQAMTSGDMAIRISVDSNDEIGILGNAFNLMSDAIRKRIDTLNNMSTFLRSIITQSPFSTWVSDNKGTCIMMNNACMRLFAIEKEDQVVGRYNLFEDNVLIEQGYIPIIEKVFKGETVDFTIDYNVSKVRHINVKGGEKILRIKIFPIIDSHGKVTNAIVMHEDITEKKKMEDALIHSEKLSAIGTFAAGVAHEVNNPLTTILGYASMFKNENGIAKDIKDKLDIIEKEAIRARGILRALLDFARRTELKLEEVFIVEIMENTLLLIKEDAKKFNINISKDYTDIPKILADRNQITQVFLNMANNAIQAMPHGGELKITIGNHNEEVFVGFSDTGVGIPEESLIRIFDPFFTTKTTGTGLGLSVSYGIIKRHGGSIEVSNNKERGATFAIRLPIKGSPL